MKCTRPGCEVEANHIWEGEVLCHDHAVDKREALLTAILKDSANKTNETWIAFYNSRKSAGEVDRQEKQA